MTYVHSERAVRSAHIGYVEAIMVLVVVSMCVFGDAQAQQTTAVTEVVFNDAAAPRAYITSHPNVILQRVAVPSQSLVTQVTIELSGPAENNAGNLVVYGHEGGLLAPRSGKQLFSMPIHKKSHGREVVTVNIHPPLLHAGGQMFVGLAEVAPSIRVLLVDDRTVEPCVDAAGLRGAAVFTSDFDSWAQTKMPMALTMMYETAERNDLGYFARDTTVDPIADRKRNAVPYVTSGDVDGDGFIELASAGVLFKNERGRLQAIDMQDTGSYPTMYFVDVNGDERDELLLVDGHLGGGLRVFHWHGRELTPMTGRHAVIPGAIVSMTTLREGDGAELVAVVEEPTKSSMYIMKIDRKGEVTLSPMHHPLGDGITSVVAADVTGDGRRDVVVRSQATDAVLSERANGEFEVIAERVIVDTALEPSAASLVPMDDSVVGILLPKSIHWQRTKTQQSIVAVNLDDRVLSLFDDLPEWDERPSSAFDAVLTGSAHPQRLVFGQGRCRALRVFERQGSSWVDVTAQVGLDGIVGARDGLVADIDNDGCNELIVDRDGRFEVYHRTCVGQRQAVSTQRSHAQDMHDKALWQTKISYGRGRGRLMQEPAARLLNEPVNDVASGSTRLSRDGDQWFIEGMSSTSHVNVVVATITGSVVANEYVSVEAGRAKLSFSSTSLASGTYTVTVSAEGRVVNHIIHLLK